MKEMTLVQMANACGGTIYNGDGIDQSQTATGVVIDSRLVEPGHVFVAIKGERVDGHRFIPDVFKKGAMAVLCEELPKEPVGPCILVGDCQLALKQLAAYYREILGIPVVGITGSVGKTSTKELIAAVLSEHFSVLKTEGNYNNEIGLPLTIFKIRDHHEIAVLEMGINSFGEMHRLSEVAKPDVCVMTNIGECHLENLIDRDGVLRAKSEIFDCMNKEGAVIVNADDDKLATIGSVHGNAVKTFGTSKNMTVWADHIISNGLFGSEAILHLQGQELPVTIKLPGEHMVYNAMAAAAVGQYFGLSFDEIKNGIAAVAPVAGRSHLIKTSKYVVIDDCYNANPVSMKAAIDLLTTASTRKVAVLGDMFELGENEKEMHAEIGTYAAQAGIDLLICAGALSENMYVNAKAAGLLAEYAKDLDELKEKLPLWLNDEDTILIKASHGMDYAQLVRLLTEE